MKNVTVQKSDRANLNGKLALLLTAISIGLALGSRAQAQVPFAVKFLAPSSDIRIGPDGKGLYYDSEIDVLALSVFNFSTHDYTGKKLSSAANRKIWIDLEGAFVAGTQTQFTQLDSLPTGGLLEGGMTLYAHNNEFMNCITIGPAVVSMLPGEVDYRSLEVHFTDAQGGEWTLRFARYVCGAPIYSNCRVKVAGLDDLDSDGYADVWTLEPESGKNAEAYLWKINKRQQLEPWGVCSVPFKLVFAKEQFASILDQIN